MIILAMAIYCEAKPLIEKYRLKKDESYMPFTVFANEEKEILSDDFADRFEGKVEEFIAFVSSPDIAVQGTYQQTWNYIQKDNHSLNRNSNMHLIFD